MFDYLIVGAGYSGCVLAERIATQLKKKVLIVERRDHIGGNAYDYHNDDGILLHKYGPHWFHTNDKKVFAYLSQFTEWRFHNHVVKSSVNGKLLPIPINMETINQLYGLHLETPDEVQAFYDSVKVDIRVPVNAEEKVLSSVGQDLYNIFFRNYTTKHWGIDPKELDVSVTARIPVRTNRDDRYFNDIYQGLPKRGYSAMFRHMIADKRISVLLQTDYRDVLGTIKFKKMIYTGAIDEFFDYAYGKLPYRSLIFEHETLDMEYFQPCQQVNYPNTHDFTRIVEWKHATGQGHNKTTITREYPCPAIDGREKYYPVPSKMNHDLFSKYKEETKKLKSVTFCGRLADYKYYNMDQVVARALMVFRKRIV
jgi:UDP-galactopyranose mutase